MAPTDSIEKPKAADRSTRRREKSRDAARCRRQQESDTFNEICNVIPVSSKVLAQMDRSMIMRLMISFMKFRDLMSMDNASNFKDCKKDNSEEDLQFDKEYIDALNGFIIVLSHDCDILYVSDNTKEYIGVQSLELMGQNLFGFTHEGDHLEITNSMKESADERVMRSFFIRMKSTLTSAGKNVNMKSAFYKVLKCEGVVHQFQENNQRYMVAYCEPIPHPANIEMVLDCNTFLSQHGLNMQFTFCDDDRINELLKYSEEDMIGKSFFDFCHTADIKSLEHSFKTLYRLGQITTNQYRMLVKSGGYVWVVSQATVINNPRNQQPSYVVCVHYVISGVTEENCVLSSPQLKYVEDEALPKLEEIIDSQLEIIDCQDGIIDSTESIFCDSTDTIFRDSTDSIFVRPDDSTGEIYDSTSSIYQPTVEALEAMSKNAPSIGDEIEFKDFNFDECDLIDEEMCRNAPSIGDPMWDCNFLPSKDVQQTFVETTKPPPMLMNSDKKILGFPCDDISQPIKSCLKIPENRIDGCSSSCPHTVSPVGDSGTLSVTAVKRKLPRDLQIITIPKTQYQRHVQPALALPENSETFKFNPPEYNKISQFSNPPMKRQKRQVHADSSGGKGLWECEESGISEFKTCCGRRNDTGLFSDTPLCSKLENSSWLPVLSLHDCEINAPIEEGVSALGWMTLSDILS